MENFKVGDLVNYNDHNDQEKLLYRYEIVKVDFENSFSIDYKGVHHSYGWDRRNQFTVVFTKKKIFRPLPEWF